MATLKNAHGEDYEPTLRAYTVTDQYGQDVNVDAYLLGFATSEQPQHDENAHPEDDTAPKRVRCSACRWFEARVFDVSDDENAGSRYLVHTVGRSIVPGESDRNRVAFTNSAFEVIEVLTVRQGGVPKLPVASGRALAQAAALDEEIAHAFVNRAVA